MGEKGRVHDTSFLHRYTQLHVRIEKKTDILKYALLGGGAPEGRGEVHLSQFADGKFKHTKTDRVSNKIPRYSLSITLVESL